MPTIYLIRHEKRFNDGLYDCSLTPEGINNALTKFIKLIPENEYPIYCSPMLRTIQTIYPYAKKYNKMINLDITLYEFINNNISHYSTKTQLPTIDNLLSTNFYNDVYTYFFTYIINYKTESQLLEYLKNFIIYIHPYVSEDNDDINTIYDIITKLIIQLDKKEITNVYIYENIKNIQKILKKYTMLNNINYLDKKIVIKKETYEDIILRTRELIKQMLKNDGIYVSHLTTINAIIINLYKEIYKNDYLEILKINKNNENNENNKNNENNENNEINYCKNNNFSMGTIIKLEITDKIIMTIL